MILFVKGQRAAFRGETGVAGDAKGLIGFFQGDEMFHCGRGNIPFCSRQTSERIETKDPTSWCGLDQRFLNARKTHQIIYIATGCKHAWKVLKLVRTKCASGSIQYHGDSSKDGLNEGIHIYPFHNLSSLILYHRLHPKCVGTHQRGCIHWAQLHCLANSRSPSSIKFEPSDSSVMATGFSWKYHVCHLSRLEPIYDVSNIHIYVQYATYICVYICLARKLSIVVIGMKIHCVRNGEK